jgi:AcrR family transcriptional regulator
LRRRQIVAAARALVAEGGLDGLSFRTLEDKLGFTRGVVTYHFDDKDEIVAAVLESAVAEIDAATMARVEGASTLRELLRAVLETKVRGFLDHPEASEILIAFWGRHADRGPVQAAMANLFGNYRGQSVQLLRMAKREAPKLQVDEPALAAVLVGVVVGLVVQARFEPRAVDVTDALREAEVTLLARLGLSAQ